MRGGYIGLGNVGGKLAGSLRRNDWQVCVYDLSAEVMALRVAPGASTGATPAAVTGNSDVMVTYLPSPTLSAAVMEGPVGILAALAPAKRWTEISTIDANVVQRQAARAAPPSIAWYPAAATARRPPVFRFSRAPNGRFLSVFCRRQQALAGASITPAR